jgi:hypothetical protein
MNALSMCIVVSMVKKNVAFAPSHVLLYLASLFVTSMKADSRAGPSNLVLCFVPSKSGGRHKLNDATNY